jgi:hypothetical protein
MLNDTKWTFGNARPKRTWWKTMAIVAACGATSACDSATEVLRLDEIRLDPAIIQLNPGDAVVVEAILTDQHGSSFPLPELTWSSENGHVATVTGDAGGAVVTAIAAGAAPVHASSGGVSGSALVTVTPHVPPRPPPDLPLRAPGG